MSIFPPTGNLGMGFCPLGFSLFGFGVPATAGSQTGTTLEKNPDGPNGDARFIDVNTRDYVINANGLVTGQSAIAQQVYLAIVTTLGSSVNQDLGSEFSSVRTFDAANYSSQMTNIVQQALANLIKNGSVSLVGVDANLNSNGVAGNVIINWIDNTTNQLNQTSI